MNAHKSLGKIVVF